MLASKTSQVCTEHRISSATYQLPLSHVYVLQATPHYFKHTVLSAAQQQVLSVPAMSIWGAEAPPGRFQRHPEPVLLLQPEIFMADSPIDAETKTLQLVEVRKWYIYYNTGHTRRNLPHGSTKYTGLFPSFIYRNLTYSYNYPIHQNICIT